MWEQMRSNQRRSIILVVGMAALLVGVGYGLGEYFLQGGGAVGVLFAFILWVVLSLVSYFQGGQIMLALSGAKRIEKADHPRLYNIVEEMTIAAGLPKLPETYIIDDPAPNAFATGRDPHHCAVAVTSGLLSQCNRDELQGVVAHEMGHIKNRDVLLMIMVGVMLGTIVILSDLAIRLFFYSGGRRRRTSTRQGGGQAQAIILLIALVLVILGPILAQFIYFAISRRREYLADASGALFTRYPEGLASALEKISASPQQVEAATRATSPMYIINPFKQKAVSLTATHPPVWERIRILRSMGGGASLQDYEMAFRKVRGGKGGGIIPPSTLAKARPSAVREDKERIGKDRERMEMVRETTDLLWKLNHYFFVRCVCGTKLKIPPFFRKNKVICPHCNAENEIPSGYFKSASP